MIVGENKDIETNLQWSRVLDKLNMQFGRLNDTKDVIFLIGVQELGRGYQNFTKDEKMDLMHIGICRILSPYGYYKYNGVDKEGWPH